MVIIQFVGHDLSRRRFEISDCGEGRRLEFGGAMTMYCHLESSTLNQVCFYIYRVADMWMFAFISTL